MNSLNAGGCSGSKGGYKGGCRPSPRRAQVTSYPFLIFPTVWGFHKTLISSFLYFLENSSTFLSLTLQMQWPNSTINLHTAPEWLIFQYQAKQMLKTF